MDYPIYIDTIPQCTLRGHRQIFFLIYYAFLYLQVILILGNIADSDEMQHYAAFHLGNHCSPKYPFMNIQCTKD